MKCSITKEENKYSKAYKWHNVITLDNGSKISDWYVSKCEAMQAMNVILASNANKYNATFDSDGKVNNKESFGISYL